MPDISMCRGEGCKNRDTCLRFTAAPGPFRQSYFVGVPHKPGEMCWYYWPTEKPR